MIASEWVSEFRNQILTKFERAKDLCEIYAIGWEIFESRDLNGFRCFQNCKCNLRYCTSCSNSFSSSCYTYASIEVAASLFIFDILAVGVSQTPTKKRKRQLAAHKRTSFIAKMRFSNFYHIENDTTRRRRFILKRFSSLAGYEVTSWWNWYRSRSPNNPLAQSIYLHGYEPRCGIKSGAPLFRKLPIVWTVRGGPDNRANTWRDGWCWGIVYFAREDVARAVYSTLRLIWLEVEGTGPATRGVHISRWIHIHTCVQIRRSVRVWDILDPGGWGIEPHILCSGNFHCKWTLDLGSVNAHRYYGAGHTDSAISDAH